MPAPLLFSWIALSCLLNSNPVQVSDGIPPHSAGIYLCEIVKIETIDARPADGNLHHNFYLKPLRGTGYLPKKIYAVEEYGGLRPGPPPPLPKIFTPTSLEEGDQAWFIFGSEFDFTQEIHRVLKWWKVGSPNAKLELLEKLVKDDALSWQPKYFSEVKLTLEHKATKDQVNFRIRRGREILWGSKLAGELTHDLFSLRLRTQVREEPRFEIHKDDCLLTITVGLQAEASNRFKLPPKHYKLIYAFDAKTGDLRKLTVTDFKVHAVRAEFTAAELELL